MKETADSIVEVVANHAAKSPEKLCIADLSGAYTYKAVWEQIKAAAQTLKKMGIKKNDCVMVECTQDATFLICDFACEMCGAIFVPVEHRASDKRIESIIYETDAVLLICTTEYDVPIKRMSATALFAKQNNIDSNNDMTITFPKAQDTAELLYTTGTTGASKGIEITHSNNIALAENIMYGTQMKESNVELVPLPLSHSHGIRCCYANLLNGSTIVLIEGVFRIKKVFELIEKYSVTAIDMSPSTVLILEQLVKGKLSEISGQIDYIQVGTEVLQEHVKELLMTYFPSARLYNFYGSTESGRTCVFDFNHCRKKCGCIGKPTKNAHFIVTDEHRSPIEASEQHMGLLATSGPMNMRGYWRQPELTQEIMRDGYIYTNDLGYIDEDGYIYMFGRMDYVINCNGIKISPEEIEESVRQYGQIIDCACIPKTDELSGQVPKLFVVVKNEKTFQKKELFDFLKKCIDGNKMPKEIEIIGEIPRTYNGKIRRSELMNLS